MSIRLITNPLSHISNDNIQLYREEAQKELSQKTPATGIELSNAHITLKSGEKKPFFISLNTIDTALKDALCVRVRIYDPSKGKEEFKVLLLEPSNSTSNEDTLIKIIDISYPNSRKVIGTLPQDEDLPTLMNIPSLLLNNKIINQLITQRALSLAGIEEKDRTSDKKEELKLLLHPTQSEHPIHEELSFTYQVPHGETDTNGYTSPVDIPYTSSLNRLISEIGTLFSNNYTSSIEPDIQDPSIITQKITINSDAIISIDYFGEDEKTKSRVYHIEVRRFDETKPITSLHLVEEASGRLTLHSYSASSEKLMEREIGILSDRINFEQLALKFTKNEKLSKPEKALIEKLLNNLTSYPRIISNDPKLTTDSPESYKDCFVPIHLEALQFAKRRVREGVSVIDLFKDIFTRLGLPYRYNGVVRKITLENLEDPKKLPAQDES